MVAACFTLFLTTVGGIYSWGVLQDRLVAEGLAPASTLVWIGSVQASVESVIALPGARLVAAYGPRRVALVGSILAAVGPVLASFCTHSVAGLIMTEGFLFGLGQSLCFYASAMLPATYFLRRRNLATGIVFSGAGVGGAVFSIITAQLLEATDLAWTLRIVGCIFLALNLPAALVLKSADRSRSRFLQTRKSCSGPHSRTSGSSFSSVGSSIAIFPLFVPPFFLPLYANSVGLSTSMSSLVLAGFNLSSAVGRFGFGVFADLLLGSLNSLVVCLFLVGISTLVIWPLATSVAPLVVFAIVNGLCAGGMFSLFPGTIANVFGSRNLSQFFNLIFFFWMPGYFLGSPIAGYLLQAYGGPEGGIGAYRPAIFYSGVLSLIAAGFVLAVRVIQDRSVFKKM
ncbi:putative monocarboxylate transporter [Zopfochytrium polystomum]|nr:putative monocarboxylate transporter [Zopfochytrium polystomum]